MTAPVVAKRVLHAAARTDLGRRALASIARSEPQLVVEALGPRVNREAHFWEVERWPSRLDGFEDLAFLFSSHQLHHAIIGMTVDEASYLYKLARGLPARATIVEIGRSRGGSTLLLAAAMPSDGLLASYDVYERNTPGPTGRELDDALREVLERYGVGDQVELFVRDSKTAPFPARTCDLVLVDGDHSYEGVRADYEHWRASLPVGGHLVFHDAAAFGDLSVPHDDVARLTDEIERDDAELRRVGGAGTLLHFMRVAA